jgi:hypothetical protein
MSSSQAALEDKINVYDRRPNKIQTELELEDENRRIKKTLRPMQGFVKDIYLMPTFEMREPPRLLKKTGHYPSESLLPTGIVMNIDPNTPLTSDSAHLVVNHNTGNGISLFHIRDSKHLNDREIERRLEHAAAAHKLPVLSPNSTHSIDIVSSKCRGDLYPNYSIVVEANDDAAATAVLEHLKQASPSLTIQELAEGPVLNDLRDSSMHVRRQMAKNTADALGLEIEDEPAVSAVTNQVVRATVRQTQPNGAMPVSYKVFSGAFNTQTAHSGVLVSNGKLSGYTHMRSSAEVARSHKPPSRGWTNDATSSSFSTHNGKFDERSHKSAEIHPQQNDDTLKAFKNKVHFKGPVDVDHPLLSEKHAARDDPTVKAWMNASGPAHKETSLEKTEYHFVGGIAPDTSTLGYLSTKELVELAKKIKDTPGSKTKSIVVPLDSKVVTQIVSDWHHISKLMPSDYSLDRITSSIGEHPVDPILTTLSLDEAYAKEESSAHKHIWHGSKSSSNGSSEKSAPTTVKTAVHPTHGGIGANASNGHGENTAGGGNSGNGVAGHGPAGGAFLQHTSPNAGHGGGGGGGGGHFGGGGGGGHIGGHVGGGGLHTFNRDHPRLEGGRGILGGGWGYGYPYGYDRFGTAALDLPLLLALEANGGYGYNYNNGYNWDPPLY